MMATVIFSVKHERRSSRIGNPFPVQFKSAYNTSSERARMPVWISVVPPRMV